MKTKNKHKSLKTICLSDLHSGSTKAILLPDFRTIEGNRIVLNGIQEWLFMCWLRMNEFVEEVVDGDPFDLVINGDLIEGIHHHTTEVWSPSVKDHSEAVIKLLKPLVKKARRTFIIRGTECHTGNTEISIADALGAQMNHVDGIRTFDRLTLDVNGVRYVFRHHIGTSIRRGLAGTQLSLNLAEEQIEAVNNGEPLPRVVGCAHRHKVGLYEDDNGICFVSPPWQALTRFGHKVVSQARTKPGVIILDASQKNHGELPDVYKKVYECPHPQPANLD